MAGIFAPKSVVSVFLSSLFLQPAPGADFSSASDQTRLLQRQSATVPTQRPWVWEVTTARAKIWLAGCLHLGTPADAACFPCYLPFYKNAETIYFETVPGSSDSYEVRTLIDRRGFIADRQLLSSRVSRETWQKLNSVLRTRPKTLASVKTMEPWLAAFTLMQDGYAKAGLDGTNSLGTFVQTLAMRDRKTIRALETARDQIFAMADASSVDQEEFLRDTLNGLGQLNAGTQALRAAWSSGNQSDLQTALGLDSTASQSGMHRRLIEKRNQRWVDEIKKIAERGKDSLIVVGVEHLVATPYALPDLLEQAGFEVRKIAAANAPNK